MTATEFELHPVDLGIIFAYALLMIGLGMYFGRKHDNAQDYFLAGRRMIWPLIGISLFASNVSSTTLVGVAGDAYSTGISVFNYESMAAIVLIFGVFFFFPFLLRSGVYTMPEFLERRYNSKARTYFSLLTLFLNIVVDTAGSLYAGALVLKLLFPELPLWQTVAMLAVAAGIYTIVGGLAAVMYTDALQALLLIIGSIFIASAAFSEAGGWQAVMSHVPPEMVSLIRPIDDPSVPWPGLLTGVPLLGFYFWCTNQFMVQRVISAKDLNHGRWGALFAGALKLPVLFIMVLPGTAAILLYPDLPRPDLVYPTLMFDLLPTGLLGLVLAGFIAALMSQIDSTLNSASTLVTMDFVRRAKPDLNAHQLMRVGQVATFLFMILAVAWAPQIENFGSLFKYLQRILAYAVPPVVTMFLAGMFWRRANSAGAVATIVAGVVGGAILFVLNEITNSVVLHFLYIAPLLFVVCTAAMIIVSLASAEPAAEKVASMTWSPQFFRDETAELAALPWYKNYRILAAILTAAFLIQLWLFR
ncbi:MAG: sodium/solute symporter [Gammaproteobacteria bacterium]|nr:sodium/solute symporter [Gammaproteobacteria bacterium]